MDLFRLTYFVAGSEKNNKWNSTYRHETFGSKEAIFDLWFHLNQLRELTEKGIHPSACPMFIEVRNKDGELQDLTKGWAGMNNCNTFK